MSTQPAGTVPQWTPGDRLRKAREQAGYSQQELAENMGVARNTIGNYELDASERPRKIVLRAWALATGVDLRWLETGIGSPHNPDGLPHHDSNVEPAGYTGVPLLTLLAA